MRPRYRREWGRLLGAAQSRVQTSGDSGRVFFLPEVREFIKDTRPKINTTRGGFRLAYCPVLYARPTFDPQEMLCDHFAAAASPVLRGLPAGQRD